MNRNTQINMVLELKSKHLFLMISLTLALLMFSVSSSSSERTVSKNNNKSFSKQVAHQIWLDKTIETLNKEAQESRAESLEEVSGFSKYQFSLIPEKVVKTDDWLGMEVHYEIYSGKQINYKQGMAFYQVSMLEHEPDTIKAICSLYIENMKNDEYYHRMIFKIPSGEIIKTLTIDHAKCKRYM